MTGVVGLKIHLERTRDKLCSTCGYRNVFVKNGFDLHCSGCGQCRGRLPEQISIFLEAAIDRFGRPAHITIQNSTCAQPLPACECLADPEAQPEDEEP